MLTLVVIGRCDYFGFGLSTAQLKAALIDKLMSWIA